MTEIVSNIALEKRLEQTIAIWESDSESFEKLDEEIDLENEMFNLLNELENKNLWREIETLDRAVQCQQKRYKDVSKHISQALIPLYLADDRDCSKEEKNHIENYLKPFYENPAKSTEILFNVLDKLICYDQSSIAVDLCKKVYTKIATSDDFFENPADEIAEKIVFDEFQEVYTRIKSNLDIDWESCDKRFKSGSSRR